MINSLHIGQLKKFIEEWEKHITKDIAFSPICSSQEKKVKESYSILQVIHLNKEEMPLLNEQLFIKNNNKAILFFYKLIL